MKTWSSAKNWNAKKKRNPKIEDFYEIFKKSEKENILITKSIIERMINEFDNSSPRTKTGIKTGQKTRNIIFP